MRISPQVQQKECNHHPTRRHPEICSYAHSIHAARRAGTDSLALLRQPEKVQGRARDVTLAWRSFADRHHLVRAALSRKGSGMSFMLTTGTFGAPGAHVADARYPRQPTPQRRRHRGRVAGKAVARAVPAASAAYTVTEALTYRALVECAGCGAPATAPCEGSCPACLAGRRAEPAPGRRLGEPTRRAMAAAPPAPLHRATCWKDARHDHLPADDRIPKGARERVAVPSMSAKLSRARVQEVTGAERWLSLASMQLQ